MALFLPEKTFKIPTYKRLEADLRARLARSEWRPGSMLPGRRDLAMEYGVEVATLQRAIAALLQDGTLEANGGRGTFVAKATGLPAADRFDGATTNVSEARANGILGVACGHHPMNPWGSRIVSAIEKNQSHSGRPVRFYSPTEPRLDRVDISRAAVSLMEQGCSSVIILLLQSDENEDGIGESARLCAKSNIPVVFITHWQVKRPTLNICYDSFDAGYQASKHLIDQGCRRILFIHSMPSSSWSSRRIEGARQAALDMGPDKLVIDEFQIATPLLRPTDNHDENWQYATVARIAYEEKLRFGLYDGVIAANDHYGIHLMRIAAENGMVAGRHFLIIGFDDLDEARSAGLSSLSPPLEDMAVQAALLVQEATQSVVKARRVCLHSHAVIRSSSVRTSAFESA